MEIFLFITIGFVVVAIIMFACIDMDSDSPFKPEKNKK